MLRYRCEQNTVDRMNHASHRNNPHNLSAEQASVRQSHSAHRSVEELADRLVAELQSYESVIVAFSAGVDSAVVAKAAAVALGERAIAATGVSQSLAAGELEDAKRVAIEIGIRHEVIETDEFNKTAYTQNASDRCFHCKTELYSQIGPLAASLDIATVVNGTNVDDLGDYRPGLEAASHFQVRSPLIECGFDKQVVRRLATHWQLSVHDKPATPCLSSRIAYGEEVTPARLQMIDRAEQFLRGLDMPELRELRVRYHTGDLARIEVPAAAIEALSRPALRGQIDRRFRELGFRFVTLDLAGFQSGSLNVLVPIETLTGIANDNSTEE